MQVKITKRGDGMYVVTTQRDGKTVQEAVGKDRAKLRASAGAPLRTTSE